LATNVFFSEISRFLSASIIALTTSEFYLSYANYILAAISLLISTANASLLKDFTPLVEAGVLPLPEVDMSILSNVVKQYKQEQSTCNDHYLRSENRVYGSRCIGGSATPEVSLC